MYDSREPSWKWSSFRIIFFYVTVFTFNLTVWYFCNDTRYARSSYCTCWVARCLKRGSTFHLTFLSRDCSSWNLAKFPDSHFFSSFLFFFSFLFWWQQTAASNQRQQTRGGREVQERWRRLGNFLHKNLETPPRGNSGGSLLQLGRGRMDIRHTWPQFQHRKDET